MITTGTASVEQQWRDGEVPYELPGLWAAHDALIEDVQATIDRLNKILGGPVTIRPRRAGDRSYLVLRVTTRPAPGVVARSQCQTGAQPVHCQVDSLTKTSPTLVPETLMRSLCSAIGITIDLRELGAASPTCEGTLSV